MYLSPPQSAQQKSAKVEKVTMHLKAYEGTDRKNILKLLGNEPFKDAIWEWQFEQNPFLIPFDPVLIANGDRLVGFNGTMPVTVKYGKEEVQALWSCDFHVDTGQRGKGLGKQIKSYLIAKSPLIMSFGVSPMATHVLERMGWRQSPDVFSYRLQHRLSSPRDWAIAGLQLINRLKPWAGRNGNYAGRIELSSSLPSSDQIDGLWSKVAPGYTKIVHRSYAYLNWRYQKHPLAKYQFLIARGAQGNVEGIIVVCQHESAVRLVDYLGPAQDGALKGALIQQCKRCFPKAQSFVVTTTDQELGKALCQQGFYRARTRPSFYVRSSINGDTDCERGWFLMSGDSDGEMLLAAREAKVELLSQEGRVV